MNRNDRQTFALLLVQVAVVLLKGLGPGTGPGPGLQLMVLVLLGASLGSVRFSSVGWASLKMHFHCIHFGGFHYVAKLCHLALT